MNISIAKTPTARTAKELGLELWQIRSIDTLFKEGATVPFIARYRKEQTGSLDEVVITRVRDRLAQLAELDKRREAILKSLEERELLTEELQKAIVAAETLTALGRYLFTLPSQAAHPGYHRPGERTGAAGHFNTGPG